jgi:hypothetical protein
MTDQSNVYANEFFFKKKSFSFHKNFFDSFVKRSCNGKIMRRVFAYMQKIF